MSLPKRNLCFTIPSVYDDTELDCRLYYPRRTEQNSSLFGRCFAIVAHPYAPLGGSYDDPVVALAGNILLRQGFILITFNFRGAAGSSGRTSWSGKPELADYVSVYGFALFYMDAIWRHRKQKQRQGSKEGDGQRLKHDSAAVPPTDRPLLVLAGYSYGSMITSHLPKLEVVAQLFEAPKEDSAEKEIQRRACDLARDGRAYIEMYTTDMTLSSPRGRRERWDQNGERSPPATPHQRPQLHHPVTMGGYESDVAGRRVSRESSRRSIDGERVKQSFDRVRHKMSVRKSSSQQQSPTKILPEDKTERALEAKEMTRDASIVPRIAFVLISPLLPPVAGFITMFSKLKLVTKASNMCNSGPNQEHDGGEFEQLVRWPCLCVFGSKDAFTSDGKLQRWTEQLRARAGSQFVSIRTNSGHFWIDSEGIVRLQQGMIDWIAALSADGDKRSNNGDDGLAQGQSPNGIFPVETSPI
ncbi:hypothetical protein PV10_02073 [Exophiala mesophila]|uniref:AB hydrolase-1 domain-containing protein n=1 Tax=Exophiala mesophila TaxID=212818 RepID=A0A0D1Y179_EXOME|nr:uncharacterized protein PV10_02073 [Exophiala mesophila]KIV94291.1 hypothetical protein PV10_02073 [Exophiala mesophila]